MAVTNLKTHESIQLTQPALRTKTASSFTWGAGGNSAVVVDPNVSANSQIDWWVTGTTPQQGQWSVTIIQGQFTITSSSSENSSLPVSYLVF